MYVCVCNAVTEQQVNTAINAGASTMKALNRELGVGSQCGACVGCAKACLKQASQRKPAHLNNVISITPAQAAA